MSRSFTSILLGVGLVAAVALGVPQVALADAFDNFPVEIKSDDSPSCFEIDTNVDDSIVGFFNDCSSPVVMEASECRGWECPKSPYSETPVGPGEGTGIAPHSLGISEEEFEEGDTFDLAVAWSRESESGETAEEGQMVFEVRYAEGRDGTPDGCGGCRSTGSEPKGASWLILLVCAAACARRVVGVRRADPSR